MYFIVIIRVEILTIFIFERYLKVVKLHLKADSSRRKKEVLPEDHTVT